MGKDKVLKNVEDYYVETPDYRKMIIEMVSNIDDAWILEQIHRCIKNII